MSRRPLVPLLALAALLALPPAVRGISCYSCSDLNSQSEHQSLVGSAPKLPCSTFDKTNSSYKIDPCVGDFTASCIAVEYQDGRMIRGCHDVIRDNCTSGESFTKCICTGDYCNSAGLSTPALLLLLPAALLAALHTRQ
ncbi:hypothetical protein FJT64_014718 [Amphibalanus amphitrite]|uniref:Protein sleepless n=1 Tax=Amphibalanus amphitrite TaxID=1232801 RepID=A0A6A4V8Z2_AMPAM|nr:hypothetical protein FJT64_014718 [Amphibalanus amphitrite]